MERLTDALAEYWHAVMRRELGIAATIVMPRTTPTVKVMQTEAVGGTTFG